MTTTIDGKKTNENVILVQSVLVKGCALHTFSQQRNTWGEFWVRTEIKAVFNPPLGRVLQRPHPLLPPGDDLQPGSRDLRQPDGLLAAYWLGGQGGAAEHVCRPADGREVRQADEVSSWHHLLQEGLWTVGVLPPASGLPPTGCNTLKML